MSKKRKQVASRRSKRKVPEHHISLLVLLSIIPIIFGLNAILSSGDKYVLNKNKAQVVPTAGFPLPSVTPTPTTEPTSVYTGYCVTVPVLLYHHIQPQARAIERGQTAISVDNGVFNNQMAYIKSQGYTTITAKQLVDALLRKSDPPKKSIVITLDDGYKDNHEFAFPTFQKYGITANILLSSGLMEGADYLNWSQVQDMKNSGLVYFVNHTWSHFSLPSGDAQKITEEINTAKNQIEANTGQTTDVFGYPYGSFNDQSINILTELGYIGAFSTIPGWIQCDSFLMTLHRNRIGNSSLSAYGL